MEGNISLARGGEPTWPPLHSFKERAKEKL
jgi:hypothetical protein